MPVSNHGMQGQVQATKGEGEGQADTARQSKCSLSFIGNMSIPGAVGIV